VVQTAGIVKPAPSMGEKPTATASSQASFRYRVTEGGLELSAIARGVLGKFSCQARQVTPHLITRRGRLGTRVQPQVASMRGKHATGA